MMANLARIRDALETVRDSRIGIRIVRGACFSWVAGCSIPESVNWAGAVLWTYRSGPGSDFSTARLLSLVDADLFWLYRFSLGFDQGRAISVTDPKTEHELHKDEVGLAGQRLAREFAPWPK